LVACLRQRLARKSLSSAARRRRALLCRRAKLFGQEVEASTPVLASFFCLFAIIAA
jgi:hypothetical protein